MANVNLTTECRYKLGFVRNGTEHLRDAVERCVDLMIDEKNIDVPQMTDDATVEDK